MQARTIRAGFPRDANEQRSAEHQTPLPLYLSISLAVATYNKLGYDLHTRINATKGRELLASMSADRAFLVQVRFPIVWTKKESSLDSDREGGDMSRSLRRVGGSCSSMGRTMGDSGAGNTVSLVGVGECYTSCGRP